MDSKKIFLINGKMKKRTKIALLVTVDILTIIFAYTLTIFLKYDIQDGYVLLKKEKLTVLMIIGLYIAIFSIFKMYRSIWTIASIDEGMRGGICGLLGTLVASVLLLNTGKLDPKVSFVSGFIIFAISVSVRFSIRTLRRLYAYREIVENSKK